MNFRADLRRSSLYCVLYLICCSSLWHLLLSWTVISRLLTRLGSRQAHSATSSPSNRTQTSMLHINIRSPRLPNTKQNKPIFRISHEFAASFPFTCVSQIMQDKTHNDSSVCLLCCPSGYFEILSEKIKAILRRTTKTLEVPYCHMKSTAPTHQKHCSYRN